MELKVIQIGNSGGVIIPRETRRELGIRIGEKVSADLEGSKLVISNPKRRKKIAGVDAKFAKIVDEFMDEHEDVLKELASR